MILPHLSLTGLVGWSLFLGSFLLIIYLLLVLLRYKQSSASKMQLSAQLKILFDNIPDPAWLKDSDSRYIAVNKTMQNIFNSGNEAIAGKTDFDLWPADIATMYYENDRQVISSRQRFIVEEKLKRPDGFEIYLETTRIPFFDASGDIAGTIGIGRDITERKSVETELTTSREKFSKLFYSSPNWLLLATVAEGRYLDVNDAFCQTTGYSREDVIGRTSIEFGLWINPDDRREIKEIFENIGSFDARPSRFRMKDGSLRDFLWSAVVIDINGEKCALSTLVDVTEIEQTRKEKEKLQGQVYHAQKMEAIGTLAGGVAHDFNNLLTGIQGRTSLMLARNELDQTTRKSIEEIEDLVRSATRLTRQLLSYARGGKYEVKHIDINQLIQKSVEMFGRTRKELIITLSLEENLKAILADYHQVEQVLLNIYINAWQAMDNKGSLHIQTTSFFIDSQFGSENALKPGNYIRISITDTGKGMDNETKSRIFEPFFTTKPKNQGTGLGLASAYGIIKNHNGMINVYSEKEKGTTFNIFLPAEGNPAAQNEVIDIKRTVKRGQETILLIDDEEFILEIGGQLLATLGYEFETANSSKKALERFGSDSSRFSLIITDLIMPQMSGEELFDKLREINPDVKIILSSGYSLNGQVAALMKRGCNGFIQKPFGLHELSNAIRDVLDLTP